MMLAVRWERDMRNKTVNRRIHRPICWRRCWRWYARPSFDGLEGIIIIEILRREE
jgi:hypothetical protein